MGWVASSGEKRCQGVDVLLLVAVGVSVATISMCLAVCLLQDGTHPEV